MCSLQEAYQIPSFSSAVKKKCPPAQAKASADPYDPFSPEYGRGERAALKIQEAFTTQTQLGSSRDNVSYASQGTDNDYYCRTYGVCTTPPPKPVPTPNPSVPTTGRLEGFTTQGGCTMGSDNRPLRYEYPMSPEAKEAYDRAVKLSLSSDSRATATAPVEAQMRVADMSNVKGYEDEDLDKYLQTKDMKASPMISTPAPIAPTKLDTVPYDPKESPFAKAIQHFAKEENKVPMVLRENMAAENPVPVTAPIKQVPTSNDKMWDLLLIVLAGVLIIFLCDQLFRLGMMVGMKRTVLILQPFLEKP